MKPSERNLNIEVCGSYMIIYEICNYDNYYDAVIESIKYINKLLYCKVCNRLEASRKRRNDFQKPQKILGPRMLGPLFKFYLKISLSNRSKDTGLRRGPVDY